MKRRAFLAQAAGFGLGAGLTRRVAASVQRHRDLRYYDVRKLTRVGVSSNSFRNSFPATRDKSFNLPGPALALLDFPQLIADRYEVHNLEFLAAHFASTDVEYVSELGVSLRRLRSRLINLQVNGQQMISGAGLSDRNPDVRGAAVDAIKKWIDVARRLSARSVCANPGTINPADIGPTVSAYRQLAAYARARGIRVLIENRQALEPDEIVAVIRGVEGTSIGALPDFGGFANEAARVAGLRLLFPHAPTLCHAEGIVFDAVGNETAFNFQGCVNLSKQLRFRGVYSVDYKGAGDPYQGVQNVINELIRDL